MSFTMCHPAYRIHKPHIVLLLALLLALPAAARRYTVVVSLDGYRWDYPQWYDTPFIDRMAQEGVKAGLIPSFPSKTFPNHYTLATGLYPDHHGIIANEFFDPDDGIYWRISDPKVNRIAKYYGGEPIWNTAERQGKRVAVFYWPGSDVPVDGRHATIWHDYNKKPLLTLQERMDGIVSQLAKKEKERPDLVMAYLEQPDSHGHTFGPQAKETRQAVEEVDTLLSNLYRRLGELPIKDSINFIVLSDHGMAFVPAEHNIDPNTYLKPHWVRSVSGYLPCIVYAKPGYADSCYQALKQMPHMQVWRKSEIPDYLHFGTNDRIGDIVVSPDLGYAAYNNKWIDGGTHGYDPNYTDMHAVFRAVGPSFRHVELRHFENVCIYPLLCRILGIQPAPCDGSLDEVSIMLR